MPDTLTPNTDENAVAETSTVDKLADENTGPVLVFDHVSIGFEGRPVLDDISFQVKKGETRILLGPAGVGKSVIIKLANGLMRPDSGKILLFGLDITEMPEAQLLQLRRRVGMVFQESALFDSLDVEDNVGYRLNEEHMPPEEAHQKVAEALRFVELEQTMAKYPSQLSGGMRRRVAIARAIITDPDLILYDSPTGGLDPITSTTIIELVIKQRDVYGTTAVLVTHRLQDAYVMATHRFDKAANQMTPLPPHTTDPNTTFMVMNDTKMIFEGTTEELAHSEDPFLKEYLA
jgi:phospholipid/cholesterol/gamma-HCH transport system ATP-binding protein